MRGTIHKLAITIVNTCTLNVGIPSFIKQMLVDVKIQINSNTIILFESNTPLSPIYRSERQKKSKKKLQNK
jgi:hypothetical protein